MSLPQGSDGETGGFPHGFGHLPWAHADLVSPPLPTPRSARLFDLMRDTTQDSPPRGADDFSRHGPHDFGIADHMEMYPALLDAAMRLLHSELVGLVAKAAATSGHG